MCDDVLSPAETQTALQPCRVAWGLVETAQGKFVNQRYSADSNRPKYGAIDDWRPEQHPITHHSHVVGRAPWGKERHRYGKGT